MYFDAHGCRITFEWIANKIQFTESFVVLYLMVEMGWYVMWYNRSTYVQLICLNCSPERYYKWKWWWPRAVYALCSFCQQNMLMYQSALPLVAHLQWTHYYGENVKMSKNAIKWQIHTHRAKKRALLYWFDFHRPVHMCKLLNHKINKLNTRHWQIDSAYSPESATFAFRISK